MSNETLYTQFKALLDRGINVFVAGQDLGLTEDEIADFEMAYEDEKREREVYGSSLDEILDVDDIDFDDVDLGGS